MSIPLPAEPAGEPASAAALALLGCSLCEASRRLHALSLTVLGVTCIVGVLEAGAKAVLLLPVLGLMAAACQAWFAWRLAFDLPVFAAWARLADELSPQALRAFDTALERLLNKDVTTGETRPMAGRVLGARRLHQWQVAALLGQVLVFVALMGSLPFLP
jgi:hypothetical protein